LATWINQKEFRPKKKENCILFGPFRFDFFLLVLGIFFASASLARAEIWVHFNRDQNPKQASLDLNIAVLETQGGLFRHGQVMVVGGQVLFVEGDSEVLAPEDLAGRKFVRLGRLALDQDQMDFLSGRLIGLQIVLDQKFIENGSNLLSSEGSGRTQKMLRIVFLEASFDHLAESSRDSILAEIRSFQKFVEDIPGLFFEDQSRDLSVVGLDSILPFDSIKFSAKDFSIIGPQYEVKVFFRSGKNSRGQAVAELRHLASGELQLSFRFKRWLGRFDEYVSTPFFPDARIMQFAVKAHGPRFFRPAQAQVNLCWRNLRILHWD